MQIKTTMAWSNLNDGAIKLSLIIVGLSYVNQELDKREPATAVSLAVAYWAANQLVLSSTPAFARLPISYHSEFSDTKNILVEEGGQSQETTYFCNRGSLK